MNYGRICIHVFNAVNVYFLHILFRNKITKELLLWTNLPICKSGCDYLVPQFSDIYIFRTSFNK